MVVKYYILQNTNLYKYYNTIILMERKTTSFKIDPEVWKQVKIHCATQEIEICDFLEGVLKKVLKEK